MLYVTGPTVFTAVLGVDMTIGSYFIIMCPHVGDTILVWQRPHDNIDGFIYMSDDNSDNTKNAEYMDTAYLFFSIKIYQVWIFSLFSKVIIKIIQYLFNFVISAAHKGVWIRKSESVRKFWSASTGGRKCEVDLNSQRPTGQSLHPRVYKSKTRHDLK